MENKITLAPQTLWVGKIDDRKVPFHRLILEKGTTYNSYLLNTAKPTIIDTVDILFGREYVSNLENKIDLNTIQYIVINHVEPDHAGALPALLRKAKNAVVVTTQKGKELLIEMFKLHNQAFLVVKDKDTLDIGEKTLQFFETPYLHTEETMITYCVEDKILYPCDIFSTHIANEELFNDLSKDDIHEDFKIYYQLIMHPHRPYVQDMIHKIKSLDIKMIAPSHGYILRENVSKYIALYDEMSTLTPEQKNKKALILYSSLTGNTSKIAKKLAEGLDSLGIDSSVVPFSAKKIEEVRENIKNADILLLGSGTKYGDIVGELEVLLKELPEMDLSNKIGASFGSYGWSGESIEVIQNYLKQTNITLVDTSYLIQSFGEDTVQFPLRVKFEPNHATSQICIDAGRKIGEIAYR